MALKIGEPRHFDWLRGIVAGIFVLNGIDGVLTILWLATSKATEANPLMANLIDVHPVAFISAKLALVGLGTYLLWRLRSNPAGVVAIFAVFLVYYALLLYHLRSLNLRIVERLLG